MNNNTSKKVKLTCVIYLIQINGNSYVGQTTSYKSRKRDHMTAMRRGKHHNIHIQRAFDKYGEDSVKWTKLEVCYEHELDEREHHWIRFFNAYRNGFNQNEGGEHTFGIACTWNGVNYPSLSAAAEANNCATETIRRRLNSGWTCDEEVHDKGESGRIPVIWNGVQYRSITDCAKENGMSTSALSSKLAQGYTCDSDIPMQAEWSRVATVWNGVEYSSRVETARAIGVPVSTLIGWLLKGCHSDDDVNKLGNRPQSCTWNGTFYETITHAAMANGYSIGSMFKYIKNGYNCDADVPPPTRLDMQKAVEIRRLYATGDWSYSQIARKFDVSCSLIGLVVNHKIWQEKDE
jgi:hypothetical protein